MLEVCKVGPAAGDEIGGGDESEEVAREMGDEAEGTT